MFPRGVVAWGPGVAAAVVQVAFAAEIQSLAREFPHAAGAVQYVKKEIKEILQREV